eukprot:SM000262S09891  [mRNA]  locus=s262:105963:124729:- [translate_table: standard]
MIKNEQRSKGPGKENSGGDERSRSGERHRRDTRSRGRSRSRSPSPISDHRSRRGRLAEREAPSATIVLKGVPHGATEDTILELLTAWGPVAGCRIIKDKASGAPRGFAFVDFPSVVLLLCYCCYHVPPPSTSSPDHHRQLAKPTAAAESQRDGGSGKPRMDAPCVALRPLRAPACHTRLCVPGCCSKAGGGGWKARPAAGWAVPYSGVQLMRESNQVATCHLLTGSVLPAPVSTSQGDNNVFSGVTLLFPQCQAPRTKDQPEAAVPQHHSSSENHDPERGRHVNNVLMVRGLSDDIDEEALHFEFAKYAPIQELRIARDKLTHVSRGFAFVHYHAVNDAVQAMKATDGICLKPGSRPLNVIFARPTQGGSSAQAAHDIQLEYEDAGWALKEYNMAEDSGSHENLLSSQGQQAEAESVEAVLQAAAAKRAQLASRLHPLHAAPHTHDVQHTCMSGQPALDDRWQGDEDWAASDTGRLVEGLHCVRRDRRRSPPSHEGESGSWSRPGHWHRQRRSGREYSEHEQHGFDGVADDEDRALSAKETVGKGAQKGYVWDEASGYYYSAETGLYYDGHRGMYYNGNSKKWYTLDADTQQYVMYDDNDHHPSKVVEESTVRGEAGPAKVEKSARGAMSKSLVAAEPVVKVQPSLAEAVAAAAAAAVKKERKAEKEREREREREKEERERRRAEEERARREREREEAAASWRQVAASAAATSTSQRPKLSALAVLAGGSMVASTTGAAADWSTVDSDALTSSLSLGLGGTKLSAHAEDATAATQAAANVTKSQASPLPAAAAGLAAQLPFRTNAVALGSYGGPSAPAPGKRRFSEAAAPVAATLAPVVTRTQTAAPTPAPAPVAQQDLPVTAARQPGPDMAEDRAAAVQGHPPAPSGYSGLPQATEAAPLYHQPPPFRHPEPQPHPTPRPPHFVAGSPHQPYVHHQPGPPPHPPQMPRQHGGPYHGPPQMHPAMHHPPLPMTWPPQYGPSHGPAGASRAAPLLPPPNAPALPASPSPIQHARTIIGPRLCAQRQFDCIPRVAACWHDAVRQKQLPIRPRAITIAERDGEEGVAGGDGARRHQAAVAVVHARRAAAAGPRGAATPPAPTPRTPSARPTPTPPPVAPAPARLGYSQQRVDGLGVAKDIGDNCGLHAGLLCDRLPPAAMLLAGAVQNLAGYGGLYLVASGCWPPLPYWQMCVLICLGTNGATWFGTASLVTCVRNFPRSRGNVVGILKGFIGLSGAIFGQLYAAALAPDQRSFLALVAVVPALVALGVAPIIRPSPNSAESTQEEQANFMVLYVLCLSLAAYLLAAILAEDAAGPELLGGPAAKLIASGMLLVLLLPLVAPARAALAHHRRCKRAAPDDESLLQGLLPQGEEKAGASSDAAEPPPSAVDDAVALRRERLRRISEDAGSGSGLAAAAGSLPGEPWHSGAAVEATGKLSEDADCGGSAPWLEEGGTSQTWPTPPRTLPPPSPKRLTLAQRMVRVESDISIPDLDAGPPSPPPLRLWRVDSAAAILVAVGEGAVKRRRRGGPRRGEDFTLRQALVKADFWLLFASCLCGCGSGLTAINNLAQMGQAQGYADARIFVSLVSVWNFLGRLGGGFLSEYCVRERALPRPLVQLGAQALLAIGHLCFAFAVPGSLYVGSLLVGMCYGVHWAVMPATASELFGLAHFGLIYNFIALANPLGSYLFSSCLAGYIYDRECHRDSSTSSSVLASLQSAPTTFSLGGSFSTMAGLLQGGLTSAYGALAEEVGPAPSPSTSNAERHCSGAHCFRLTFLIMAGVCIVGMCTTAVLVLRTRPVYEALYAKPKDGTPTSRA